MLDCTISFSFWWPMVKMAIYTQKCEQKWLKINNRGGGGGGIKMSWVEKNRGINNRGGRLFGTWEYMFFSVLINITIGISITTTLITMQCFCVANMVNPGNIAAEIVQCFSMIRNSRPEVFFRNVVLKNFANFTWKQLCLQV